MYSTPVHSLLCTFPDQAAFQKDDAIQKLRRILIAYSWHNPDIGYCQVPLFLVLSAQDAVLITLACTRALLSCRLKRLQSMNFIAGMLVLAMEPAAAFNVLVMIMDKYMPQKYYSSTLENVVVDQQLFQMLVAEYLPKVIPNFSGFEAAEHFPFRPPARPPALSLSSCAESDAFSCMSTC